MRNNLAWDLVKSFSNSEIRRFKWFLSSPYFNKREDLERLFSYFLVVKSKGKTPNAMDAFAAARPMEIFKEQEFRLLSSYFLKAIEQFLVSEKFKENDLDQAALLLSVYRQKGLDRHFQKTLNRSSKVLETQPLRHSEYYFANFHVEREKLLHQAKGSRTKAVNLQEVEDHLDFAFLSMKLRQACTALSHQAVFNTEYRITLMDEILEKAIQPPFNNIPAIQVYYHCYIALFKEESEANFQKFKSVLFENIQRFPKEELKSLYLLVINFCIKKINANQREYLQEALDLYRSGLEEKILLDNNQLSPFTFNNVVGISMHLNKIEWAKSFVEVYKNHLDENHRETAYSLNSARLAYAEKNYKQALIHLQKSDYQDTINNMVAKILLMKIYFEIDEFDSLDAHLKTMQMFIRRNKKIGYHYKNWGNIVKYTRKLMEVNIFDKTSIQQLSREIQNEKVLTEKRWLLEQCNS